MNLDGIASTDMGTKYGLDKFVDKFYSKDNYTLNNINVKFPIFRLSQLCVSLFLYLTY